MTSSELPRAKDDTGFYEPYVAYARALRTWLVAYGIGAPALLLANLTVWNAVKASGHFTFIGVAFLAGVTLQVLAAFLYKHAMWNLYCSELDPEHAKTRRYKFADWLSNANWLEITLDLVTLVLFVSATATVFAALS